MPELPEVETTKLSLAPLLGQEVTHLQVFQPKLRWEVPANITELVGYQLTQIDRRAKYLILSFTQPSAAALEKKLIIHLGMSGSLQQRALSAENLKHDHVVFSFAHVKLNYHDPRRFGAILWHEQYAAKLFDHLAPEPLSEAFHADYLYQKLQKTQRAIKVSIMNQTCVVGVGNIYATESLYLSGIHPLTPSNALSKAQVSSLVMHIKNILAKAIQLGGSSLKDFTDATGKTGYFQQTLHAYGRAGNACTHCGAVLETIKITGRASCFCPKCQPVCPNMNR